MLLGVAGAVQCTRPSGCVRRIGNPLGILSALNPNTNLGFREFLTLAVKAAARRSAFTDNPTVRVQWWGVLVPSMYMH